LKELTAKKKEAEEAAKPENTLMDYINWTIYTDITGIGN
jgi:hypothetical protein